MTEICAYFGSNRKIAGQSQSILLEWYTHQEKNHSTKLLRPVNEYKLKRKLAIKSYLLTGTLIIFIIQTLNMQTIKDSTANNHNTLSWLAIALLNTFNCHLRLMAIKAPGVADLVNGLIQFDQIHHKSHKRVLERPIGESIRVLISYAAHISVVAIPLGFAFGLHWQYPWKASLAGQWLIPKSTESTSLVENLTTNSVKLLVILFNFWMWMIGSAACGFVVGVVHNLTTVILMDNLKEFLKYCRDLKNLSIYERALIYRHLQVLTSMLNEIQKGPLILVIIIAVIMIAAFSIATIVKNQSMGIFFLTILALLIVDAFLVIIVLLGGMSKLYETSAQILQNMRCRHHYMSLSIKEYKWERRFYLSCSSLKIMISSANFVDALTPLNVLHFAMTLSANILLVERPKLQ